MEVQVGGVLFQVVQGDITTVETDAVVNAANNHFWMGGGVAGAMKRAGGGNIESEAMSQGPQSGVRVRKCVRNAEAAIGRVRREGPFG